MSDDLDPVQQLRDAVFGNGKAGLDEQMRTVIRTQEQQDKRLDTIEGKIDRAVRIILMAILAPAVAAIWQVVTWAIAQGAPVN